jgi:hypothetical protein
MVSGSEAVAKHPDVCPTFLPFGIVQLRSNANRTINNGGVVFRVIGSWR